MSKIHLQWLFQIFQESGKQKTKALRIGPEYVAKVEEDMAEILDGMWHIHSWVRSQALFRPKSNVSKHIWNGLYN